MNLNLEAKIGLEIHIKLSTACKIFSSGLSKISQTPNVHLSPWDIAYPGFLPILNKNQIIKALNLSKIFKCDINQFSYFDRKHYSYPDLPAGYQITQKRKPLAQHGHIDYICENKGNLITQRCYINQIQLEHDSGKSLKSADGRYLDFNRSGVGLVEIVTLPCFVSGNECVSFIGQLLKQLTAFNLTDGRMETGSCRVDVNLHVTDLAQTRKPAFIIKPRSEIKNLNSLSHINQAIDYEIKRLTKTYLSLLERAQDNIVCDSPIETLGYDAITNKTYVQRKKQSGSAYRYIPEPNIPPIHISPDVLNEAKNAWDQEISPYGTNLHYLNSNVIKSSIQLWTWLTTWSTNELVNFYITKLTLSPQNAYQLAQDCALSYIYFKTMFYNGSARLKGQMQKFNPYLYTCNPHHTYSLITTTVKTFLNENGVLLMPHHDLKENSAKESTNNHGFKYEKSEDVYVNSVCTNQDFNLFHVISLYVYTLVNAIDNECITLATAKSILTHFLAEKETFSHYPSYLNIEYDIQEYIETHKLHQINDIPTIRSVVNDILLQRKLSKKSGRKRREIVIKYNHEHYQGRLNLVLLNHLLDDKLINGQN